ncbi:MAG: 30S ribosomal protein S8 [Candidatus Anoxychlamydiales bacterium]|uniref:30S ribosomal protein S8 n=1 Tax=marine sediment metagenome TaxID=412755 RepID=A0A0F9J0S4_9ZZZZ|nr:30S ribosomal protein S8 [Candidatus Anoxychlamydiales bacterium]NGX40905.1 30S ribosomal protein S8 [Candidatus Anoxychlamydiales bacterium]HEU64635.1 30S ribosomal protein S8 [Chlamydiota bacterium]
MSFNDPIAEFLTKIRNAQKAQHKFVDITLSKMKINLAKILKEHGYIESFLQNEQKRKMRIFLKYTKDREGIIRLIKRISKPGRRLYASKEKLPRVLGGIGLAIVSTSKGVMTDEDARKQNVGGEILCYIW